jgi:hypothetical protein
MRGEGSFEKPLFLVFLSQVGHLYERERLGG